MKTIIPYLWCSRNAEELVQFYTQIFPQAQAGKKTYYTPASAKVSGMKEGELLTYQFRLLDQEFVALNGGDLFKFSPAVSLTVSLESDEQIHSLWEKLLEGGSVLMPLQEYPFSKKYGWLQDQFGVSWQLRKSEEPQESISPSLLFVGEKYGKAEEAAKHYADIFKDQGQILDLGPFSEKGPDPEGEMTYALLKLRDRYFTLMDGPGEHNFDFTGAISFLVDCEDQAEIDYFWSALSEGGEELPCGWVKDRYGVHWQVFSLSTEKFFEPQGSAAAEKALEAMYEMKKIILADIRNAYESLTR